MSRNRAAARGASTYGVSFLAGAGAGLVFWILHTPAPVPPLVGLVGLAGIAAGEHATHRILRLIRTLRDRRKLQQ